MNIYYKITTISSYFVSLGNFKKLKLNSVVLSARALTDLFSSESFRRPLFCVLCLLGLFFFHSTFGRKRQNKHIANNNQNKTLYINLLLQYWHCVEMR